MLLWPRSNDSHNCARNRSWNCWRYLAAKQTHPSSSHRRLWNNRIPRKRTSHKSSSNDNFSFVAEFLLTSFSLPVRSAFLWYTTRINCAIVHERMESRAAKTAVNGAGWKGEFRATVKAEKGRNWIKVDNFTIQFC